MENKTEQKKELMPVTAGNFVFSEIDKGSTLRQTLEDLRVQGINILGECKKIVTKQENGKYILKGEEDREVVAIYLKDAHELEKEIKRIYKTVEDPLKEISKKVKAKKAEDITPAHEAKNILSVAVGEYEAILKRKREEEARKVRERIEQERLREAEEKAKKAMELKETGNLEDMAEALNLDTEVEDLLDAPIPEPVVIQPEKLSGIRQQRIVKCKITNEKELLKYIIVKYGIDKPWFLKVNETEIRKYVKQQNGKVSMPGLKVWVDNKASSTGR
jgi:hypothetical protein